MERGEITEVAFLETLTDSLEPLLGHRPEMHRFKEIYFEALNPNPPMIDLMRELKDGGYRMAMLTNRARPRSSPSNLVRLISLVGSRFA